MDFSKYFSIIIFSFIVLSCKVSEQPKLEVPEQSYSCESELCRTVDKPTDCESMGGIWSKENNSCLTTEEFRKLDCILDKKVWDEDKKECSSSGVVKSEKLPETLTPDLPDGEKTDVDLELEVVE